MLLLNSLNPVIYASNTGEDVQKIIIVAVLGVIAVALLIFFGRRRKK